MLVVAEVNVNEHGGVYYYMNINLSCSSSTREKIQKFGTVFIAELPLLNKQLLVVMFEYQTTVPHKYVHDMPTMRLDVDVGFS